MEHNNHDTEKSFEDLTNEEKMLILALYKYFPIPQDLDQIRETIERYGWNKLDSEQLNQLRIELVQSRLN
jgi:hypothetical protein